MAAGCWGTVNIVWPDLTPIENLWNQLSRRVEAHSSVHQSLNDQRATLQEEWDAVPQQTIQYVDFHDILLLQCGLFMLSINFTRKSNIPNWKRWCFSDLCV